MEREGRGHTRLLGEMGGGVMSWSGGQSTPCLQPWMSDTEESPFMDPALRKRAVKVKHVKRREKKSEKKVMERVNRVCTGEDGAGREPGKEPESWSTAADKA